MWVRVMVFNATFNNISVKLWWSVLLVEETRVPEETNLDFKGQRNLGKLKKIITEFLIDKAVWQLQR
jgi:hypothetical protein